MKIKNYGSTLSCILKCIRFSITMINKKIFFGLFITSLLTNCSSPTVMLGPAYTLGSTGNAFQAGLSFGSNKAYIKYKEIYQKESDQKITKQKKNLEFRNYLKTRIAETRKKIKTIK